MHILLTLDQLTFASIFKVDSICVQGARIGCNHKQVTGSVGRVSSYLTMAHITLRVFSGILAYAKCLSGSKASLIVDGKREPITLRRG